MSSTPLLILKTFVNVPNGWLWLKSFLTYQSSWWLAPGFLTLLALVLLERKFCRKSIWLIFGLAWFTYALGVRWLFTSLHDYGEMPALIAVLAVIALAGYMACYPLLAAVIFRYLNHKLIAAEPSLFSRVWQGFAWAACWSLAEYARATWFTGFPWLSVHDVWVDSPFRPLLPWIGGHSVSILVLGLMTSLFTLILPCSVEVTRQAKITTAIVLILLLVGLPMVLAKLENGVHQVGELEVVLVQPNIDQKVKFDPQLVSDNVQKTLALARSAMLAQQADGRTGALGKGQTQGSGNEKKGQPQVAALILPETALPVLWNEAPAPWRQGFQALADDFQVPVIMGVAIDDRDAQQRALKYTNSVVALYPAKPGQQVDASFSPNLPVPSTRYDKRHLVPFGETIPWGFGWFVAMMNMPLGEFTRGEGAPAAFPLEGGFHLLPNVCYEDAFGAELAQVVASSQPLPQVLLNVSNLAWFGRSQAMEQHGQLSRTRAAELGRAMIRATNTGISGVALPDGTWLGRLPVVTEVSARFTVPMFDGMTAFMRWPNRVWWGLTLLILVWGLVLKYRYRSAEVDDTQRRTTAPRKSHPKW